MANSKNEAKEMRKQIVEKVGTLIISAFGLIAALAWNSAIQSAVSQFLHAGSALEGLIVYALIVTIMAVLVTIYLSRLTERVNK